MCDFFSDLAIGNYKVFLDLKHRLPDISPAKMGLFRISKELQFGICNHGEPHASPHTAKEEKGKRKLGGLQLTKSPWLFFG